MRQLKTQKILAFEFEPREKIRLQEENLIARSAVARQTEARRLAENEKRVLKERVQEFAQ